MSYTILDRTDKSVTISTESGHLRIALSLFEKRVYEVCEVGRLFKQLNYLIGIALDAIVPITRTSEAPTNGTQKCVITIVSREFSRERETTVTPPQNKMEIFEGEYHIPVECLKGKISKYDRPAKSGSPIVLGLIREVEAAVANLKVMDTRTKES